MSWLKIQILMGKRKQHRPHPKPTTFLPTFGASLPTHPSCSSPWLCLCPSAPRPLSTWEGRWRGLWCIASSISPGYTLATLRLHPLLVGFSWSRGKTEEGRVVLKFIKKTTIKKKDGNQDMEGPTLKIMEISIEDWSLDVWSSLLNIPKGQLGKKKSKVIYFISGN